ncbi:MAG TPA: hypothetical protein VGU02_11600 [Gaiellaceae bacterium]|nr:hypothetical protein [Gaiellaceae bacterium]
MPTGATTRAYRRHPGVAWTVGVTLAVFAGVVGCRAALLHDPHGLDPHWSGAGTAALFAATFVGYAEWSTIKLGQERTSVWATAGWIAVAVLSLFALLAVAVAGNLGG